MTASYLSLILYIFFSIAACAARDGRLIVAIFIFIFSCCCPFVTVALATWRLLLPPSPPMSCIRQLVYFSHFCRFYSLSQHFVAGWLHCNSSRHSAAASVPYWQPVNCHLFCKYLSPLLPVPQQTEVDGRNFQNFPVIAPSLRSLSHYFHFHHRCQ